jgi:hypothetical protein
VIEAIDVHGTYFRTTEVTEMYNMMVEMYVTFRCCLWAMILLAERLSNQKLTTVSYRDINAGNMSELKL